MVRGIFDDYEEPDDRGPTVQVTVRVEHTTAAALQVSQDRGQTTVWIPRDAVLGYNKRVYGPGDTIRIDLTEKLAEEKGLE